MIRYEKALNLILNNTKELPAEKLVIESSVGRILKEDVYSDIEMPPFNKSAMDGYAVKAIDIKRVPVQLRCIGFIEAGQVFKKKVRRGECVKIMTGASLPDDTDSVVMIEDTRQSGEWVEISRDVRKWGNVCVRGEDIKKGQKLLAKGRLIRHQDIAILATVGRRYVRVAGKPKVAVLNTGGEIVSAGHKLSGKKIYNSNGPQLLALLKLDGINPCFLGIAKDRPRELKSLVDKGLKADCLLISGGVSVGDYDLVPGILYSLGVKKVFHNVKTKPGKPLLFGKRRNTIVFGIPGNPVSNFLAYYIFIHPALLKMMGNRQCGPCFEEGILEEDFRQRPGRKHFVAAKITKRDYRYYIKPVESHGSADTLALSKADGFMVAEADVRTAKAHSRVKFITWKKNQNI
jgi:molybdopterin molybdotransferase